MCMCVCYEDIILYINIRLIKYGSLIVRIRLYFRLKPFIYLYKFTKNELSHPFYYIYTYIK